MKLSAIICSHNPRPGYLGRVLQALREQSLQKSEWELLLVDNASQEPLAERFDLSWHPAGRHIREETLGSASARARGIKEAAGDLIVYIDDDNVLAPDYLQLAWEIGGKWPALGVWGGQQLPEFEIQPEPWMIERQYLLAVNVFDKDKWSNIALKCPFPPGAGMCLRKEVGKSYAELLDNSRFRKALGRTGKSLGGCEDTDLALFACDLGYGTGLFTDLKLTHLIPKERINEDYLVKIVEMTSYSWDLLLAIRGEWKPSGCTSLLQRLSQWRYERTLNQRERRFMEAEREGKAKARNFILKNNVLAQ